MVSDNIAKIKARIAAVCARCGRDPASVAIVGVTKGRSIADLKRAIEAGLVAIGENRVQEAVLKYNAIRDTEYTVRTHWHMVGHVQTNKAKDAVRIFDLIHSVDSLRLAKEINLQAQRLGKVQDILLEVKTSSEATKFGIAPAQASSVAREASVLQHIKVRGLMTVAPLVDAPEMARPYFKVLKDLLADLNTAGGMPYALQELSMGMSDDFEVAIEEGATMVRLGRAIFAN